jgi:mRNA-degrading endonuclease RelE of RelBE toxin-antitoxin system
MDKNEKLLRKLNRKDFDAVFIALQKILSSETNDLDIKKLQGHQDLFRVRMGKLRIIFIKKGSDIEILEISRRSEKTYRKF